MQHGAAVVMGSAVINITPPAHAAAGLAGHRDGRPAGRRGRAAHLTPTTVARFQGRTFRRAARVVADTLGRPSLVGHHPLA